MTRAQGRGQLSSIAMDRHCQSPIDLIAQRSSSLHRRCGRGLSLHRPHDVDEGIGATIAGTSVDGRR